MHYQHFDLGWLAAGMVVRVVLIDNSANVRLMDEPNYQRFRRNQQYAAAEVRPRVSPYDRAVPRAGHWHVVIDHGTAGGRVASSVQVRG